MANNIHIVPHFHWDREWYFTTEESKILLVNDMEEVLERLEQDPDYPCFVMDGQTAVLEDYLSVKPENKERLRSLVQQGKLIIGPWYTQTDEMVVGGESIVRNLLYGMMDCRPFGPAMKIGYLPDSFGQSARMPQILNGFGIKRCMFWRGTSERMGSDKTEFYWDGEDNSRVMVQLLPLGYAIGKYLPTEPKALKDRLDKYFPVLDKGATTDHILLPNGHDQMPLQKNIYEVMEQIEASYPGRKTRLGRYEDLFEIIEQNPDHDVLRGEFLDGKYMRVHRSIYSSRADLKSANTRIENKITNLLEPLASIAYSLGFDYHHGLVEAIWKELMKNHAHDSIGCCCSDKVHRAIADRFFLAEDRTDNLIQFYLRKIVDAMPMDRALDKFVVFNTLPYDRHQVVRGEIITKMKAFSLVDPQGNSVPFQVLSKEIVDAGLIDRQIVHYGDYDPFVRYTIALEDTIPAMGYKAYMVQDLGQPLSLDPLTPVEEPVMENKFYSIRIQPNGSLEVTYKPTGQVYQQVLLVEDGSDDGDGYDYSPLEKDFVLTSQNAEARVQVYNSQYLTAADVRFTMALPKDLESRKAKILDGEMTLSFRLELEKDSPVLKVSLTVDNQAKDHRVRVLIPNKLAGKWSVSDNQFGRIARPVVDSAMEVWEKEKWSERPDSIYPFLSFVKQEWDEGLGVLSNSVREYELIGEQYNTIALTVFRSVGVLGKEDLYRRPGRPSGIKMETPDSQMMGIQQYEFALIGDCGRIQQRAKEYLTPFMTYNKMPYNAMKLNQPSQQTPYTYSLLRMDNPQVTLSTLKKAEDREELILRCYNASGMAQSFGLEGKVHCTSLAMLDESHLGGEKAANDFHLGVNEILTMALEEG